MKKHTTVTIRSTITNLMLLLPLCIMFFTFFLYPLAYVSYTSLTEWTGYTDRVFVGLANFIRLLQQERILISIKNNVIWSIALGFGQVGLATFIAYILARKPKGWGVMRNVLFLPAVISQVAISMLWIGIYNAEYGALNELLSIILRRDIGHNWLGSYSTALPSVLTQQVLYIGYFMVIMLAGALNVPRELYESSFIDGANVFQQDLYITLPLTRNILVTAVTLGMAYGMRHFAPTFLMTGGGPGYTTSVLGLQMYMNVTRSRLGDSAALAVMLIILGALAVHLMRRVFKGEEYEY